MLMSLILYLPFPIHSSGKYLWNTYYVLGTGMVGINKIRDLVWKGDMEHVRECHAYYERQKTRQDAKGASLRASQCLGLR